MTSRALVRIFASLLVLAPAPAQAQLLPPLPPPLPDLGRATDGIIPRLGAIDRTLTDVRTLARAPLQRARDLARRFPDRVAIDADGNAVRAGELIVIDGDPAIIRAAERDGFRLIEQVTIDELGVSYLRFATPAGVTLKRAIARLRKAAPGREVTADPLHFSSGLASPAPASAPVLMGLPPNGTTSGVRIGIVDGGVISSTPGLAQQRHFAGSMPVADDHAVAIASLLTGGAGVRASAPGARLYVADVYGADPAGGSATAIGQALAWLARERVPVVVVSLVGPPNPLLARIVAAARRLGTIVVAAVGNDGPAARPAYPASYPQAIAVTGVDGRGRVLIEAGRAAKLDYAAPGADLIAAAQDGRTRPVRGTSFAAPFVAARLAAHLVGDADAAIGALDREARDLGPKGADRMFGRGLVCGDCPTRPR